jgi:hypothetical protein
MVLLPWDSDTCHREDRDSALGVLEHLDGMVRLGHILGKLNAGHLCVGSISVNSRPVFALRFIIIEIFGSICACNFQRFPLLFSPSQDLSCDCLDSVLVLLVSVMVLEVLLFGIKK